MKIGKIEKNVQMPIGIRDEAGKKYGLLELEVGDSRFIELESEELKKIHSTIGSTIHYWGLGNKRKFSVRRCEGGCRVWRIK